MADLGADAFVGEKLHEIREPVDLPLCARVGFPVEHVGRREMREHAFDIEMPERENFADRVKVVKAYAVAVHSRVDREMRLRGKAGLFEIPVKGLGGFQVRKRGRETKFHEIGKVCRNAWPENENVQIHAVLPKKHSFRKVRHAQKIRTAVFCRKGTGERSVTIAVRLDGQQDLRIFGNGLSDELDVALESVQVDFDPVRARNVLQIGEDGR